MRRQAFVQGCQTDLAAWCESKQEKRAFQTEQKAVKHVQFQPPSTSPLHTARTTSCCPRHSYRRPHALIAKMAASASQSDAGTEYWPIHITRSDGRDYGHELDSAHAALNPNEDQDVAQLERWEVIIAGHLQNQIGPKDDST